MNSKKLLRRVFVLTFITLLLTGCGPGQIFGPTITPTPTLTPIPPTATNLLAAGDWVVNTDFGKLVFTIGVSGTEITKLSVQFSDWTCGPVTDSRTIEIEPVGKGWPITDGKFSIEDVLNSNDQNMKFSGTYDAANQKFSGTWDEVSFDTKCSGTWEAFAPK
jgi:hypothetical protein